MARILLLIFSLVLSWVPAYAASLTVLTDLDGVILDSVEICRSIRESLVREYDPLRYSEFEKTFRSTAPHDVWIDTFFASKSPEERRNIKLRRNELQNNFIATCDTRFLMRDFPLVAAYLADQAIPACIISSAPGPSRVDSDQEERQGIRDIVSQTGLLPAFARYGKIMAVGQGDIIVNRSIALKPSAEPALAALMGLYGTEDYDQPGQTIVVVGDNINDILCGQNLAKRLHHARVVTICFNSNRYAVDHAGRVSDSLGDVFTPDYVVDTHRELLHRLKQLAQ